MNHPYEFDAEQVIYKLIDHWKQWHYKLQVQLQTNKEFNWVIGISGGKDSLIAAALAKKAFGAKRIIGVLMPNHQQKDIEDSNYICDKVLEIKKIEINIGKVFDDLTYQFFKQVHLTSTDADVNLPPRLRMATLYMVAQSMDGVVVNTCNLSEDMVGYATLYGDNAGSYAPLKNLTVTEILKIGDELGLPRYLVHKTPADGLQDNSDEVRLGMSYDSIDTYIRLGRESLPTELVRKIDLKYRANKFKLDMVRIEGPEFDYPNFIINKELS